MVSHEALYWKECKLSRICSLNGLWRNMALLEERRMIMAYGYPSMPKNGETYLWMPTPVIYDVALEMHEGCA